MLHSIEYRVEMLHYHMQELIEFVIRDRLQSKIYLVLSINSKTSIVMVESVVVVVVMTLVLMMMT